MLHDIHVFLYEHKIWVLVVTVPLMVYFGRVIVAHLVQPRPPATATGRTGRPSSKPSAKFAETVKVDDLPDADVLARAKTNRMAPITVGKDGEATKPAAKDADGDALNDLFSGLDEGVSSVSPAKPADKPAARSGDKPAGERPSERRAISETGAIRRAGRMEELGFHHTIPSDKVSPVEAPPMPSPEAEARLKELTGEAKPAAPELDAILARIDQVLSQDAKKTEVDLSVGVPKADQRTRPTEVLPEAPEPPTKPDPRHSKTQVLSPVGEPETKPDAAKAETRKAPPLWARADAFDEDADKAEKKDQGKQLGLFDGDKA